MKIKMVRNADGTASVNIPQTVSRHSPAGFEWGYGGSGPADLALNILLIFVSRSQADLLYQEFKRDVIANIPYEGGELDEEDVRLWIRRVQSGTDREVVVDGE